MNTDYRQALRQAFRNYSSSFSTDLQFALMYAEGKTYEEVGAANDVSRERARQRVARCLGALWRFRLLSEYPDTPEAFANELASEPRQGSTPAAVADNLAWWRANRERLLPPPNPVVGPAAVPAGESTGGVATQTAATERLIPVVHKGQLLGYAREQAPEAARLLTADQVARKLNISSQTLANWRATGRYATQFPFVKIGGAVRYRSEDVARVQREGIVKA